MKTNLLQSLCVMMMGLSFLSSTQAQPYSATQAPAPVTTNSAALNGMVVPNGQDSVAWFEWGDLGSFANVTAATNVGNGFGVVRVSAAISGLITSRGYSCRLVVSNALGVSRGWEQRFVTGGKVIGWGAADGRAAVPGYLRDVVAISSFSPSGLALRAGGSVAVWGASQLPLGLTNIIAIAAGSSHNLALREDGTVVSWGSRTNVPPGLSNVIAVAAGGVSMALKSDGTVTMWDSSGALVINTLSTLSNVVAVSAQYSAYLALKADGTVSASVGLPSGLTNIVAIASGFPFNSHSLALRTNGTVVSWGAGVTVPSGISNVVGIAAGAGHDLVLKADGSLSTWGTGRAAYVPVDIGSNACAVACGMELSLVLRPLSPEDFLPYAHTQSASPVTTNSATLNGMAVANGLDTTAWFEWGTSTNYGSSTGLFDIGNGASVVRVSSPISGLAPNSDYYYRLVVSNSAGVKIGFGSRLTTGRKVTAWGVFGFNGLDSTPPSPASLGPIVKIGSGHIFSLALKADGGVVAWGDPTGGATTGIPATLTNAIEVAGGYSHGLAIREDRTVVTWGSWNFGTAPTVPAGLSNVVAVAGGDYHSLALKADGTVVAWGSPLAAKQINIPAGLTDVVAIAAGSDFSVVLRANGTVVVWGNSTAIIATIPTTLNKVVAISADAFHTLALKEDGTVVTWGNFAFFNSSDPSVPTGARSNVVVIAAGASYSMVLKNDNTLVLWGGGNYGPWNPPVGLSNVVAICAGDFHGVALAPNVPPQSTNASVTGLVNHDVTIALPVSDRNNDPLTARIATLPASGSLYQYVAGARGDLISSPNTVLTDAECRVIFAPAVDAFGAPYTSFGFAANDGESDSVEATLTVNIIPAILINPEPPGGGSNVGPGNPFGVSFSGITNLTYRVWASTNLVNWSVLGSATQATPGNFLFTDQAGTNLPSRFYRVSSP